MDDFLNVVLSNTAFAGVLGVVALAVQRIGRSPQLAHALWLLVLVKLVTPPLFYFDLPGSVAFRMDQPAARHEPPLVQPPAHSFHLSDVTQTSTLEWDQASADPTVADAIVGEVSTPPSAPTSNLTDAGRSSAAPTPQAAGWRVWLGVVWAGGSLLTAALLWRRLRRFRTLVSNAVEADAGLVADVRALADQMGMRRSPVVRVLDARLPPLVYAGGRRLTLLIPARLLQELDRQQIQTVIAHELAHIRRRDHWSQTFELAVRVGLWWHPLVWWAGRQLRLAAEECCDAWVVWALPDSRRSYGRALLWTVDFLTQTRRGAPVAGTAFGGPHVKQRIESIMTQSQNRRMTARALIAVVLLGVCVLPLAAQQHAEVTQAQSADDAIDAESPRDPQADSQDSPSDAAIQVALGESIQAAIDAAAENSTIVLAEGVFRERVRITKPLTMVGAGWDKTTLQPEAAAEYPDDATVTIDGANDVAIRRIKVTVSEEDRQSSTQMAAQGSVGGAAAVRIRRSTAWISGSVVVGPCGVGIAVEPASQLDISGSLIAAVWGTGVAVEGAPRPIGSSTLNMRDCVVRNCYHRGVTLGSECNNSVIENCLISGSAWHGIRYDNASPRIERNVLFGNARCGIYASGTTAATVRRNLFMRNEMGGMSCWFSNADAIEANIFVENTREAIAVVGQSTPRVNDNWFQEGALAVTYGRIAGQNDGTPRRVEPNLESNVFRGTVNPLMVDGESLVLNASNAHIPAAGDMGRDVSDFGPLDSKAEAAAYTQLDGFQSLCVSPKWPEPLAEELAIIPDGATRDWRAWKKGSVAQIQRPERVRAVLDVRGRQQHLQAAREASQSWLDDAFQIDSVEKREAAIEKVRAALRSENEDQRRQGLAAFTGMAVIRFDKASFHDLFVPLLESDDPDLRTLAAQSLVMSGVQSGDLERLIALAGDADSHVRQNMAGLIVAAAEKDLTSSSAAESVLRLLSDDDAKVRDAAIRSLWGATFSPELEARIIELSRDPQEGYDALYYALSTQPSKSEASVKRLIEFLSHRDTHNVAGRAAWGLGYGVAEGQQSLVADAALKVVAARSDGYLFKEALKRLKQYAGSNQVAAIRHLLAKPGVDGDLRTGLEEALKAAELPIEE